jgi:hypothetical protein
MLAIPPAASFANRAGFPVLLDPNTSLLARAFTVIRHSILVGADGVVKTIHVGLFRQALEDEITPYLTK